MNAKIARTATLMLVRPASMLRDLAELPPPPWKSTLLHLVFPLIACSVLFSQLLYQLVPPELPPEALPHPIGFGIYSLILMHVVVLAMASSAYYLTELFQGRSDFNRALQAVTLAWIPAWVGNIAAAFPWPWGHGLALVLITCSLALLYLAFRDLLGIRPGNRLGHYAATLICTIFLAFVIGWLLVDLIPGARPELRLGTTWLI